MQRKSSQVISETQIAVRLTHRLKSDLEALARRNERTLAAELRRAVRRHLEAEAEEAAA